MATLGIFMTIMFVVSLAGNVVLAARIANLTKLRKSTQLSSGPDNPKVISSKRHKLVESFSSLKVDQDNTGNYISYHGWHFHCTCGTIAPAVDNDLADRHGLDRGSEAGAVKAWYDHLRMHTELVDAGDDALLELQDKFDKYKAECFCHDV